MDTCSSSSSSSSSDNIIETLIKRGWCFGDIDKVKALILIQSALHGASCTVNLIESELCNIDLRSIGGESLPDSSALRSKSACVDGPKVLQISAARDISRSIIAESPGNSSNKRLLRLKLTDGHSEITAIEYSHIPSIPNDVVPGTKIRFEDKAALKNGILCLNPKVITVLGGVVQSLYEEWEMNQKYSGFTRTSMQLSKNGDTGGPPPFEKLQVGALSRRYNQQGKFTQFSGSSSRSSDFAFGGKDGGSVSGQISTLQNSVMKADNMNSSIKSVSVIERNEGKISTSESRPKEVVESIPVQNQAAAQKLLEKLNHNGRGDHHARGGKYRGRGRSEDAPVLTLDEWEKRKVSANTSMKVEAPDVKRDEDLARQLQNQFDLEDHHVQRGPQMTQADSIRMNMFSFERDNVNDDGRTGFRGRGRGRGRGRSRGRGRGRSG